MELKCVWVYGHEQEEYFLGNRSSWLPRWSRWARVKCQSEENGSTMSIKGE